MYLFDITHPSDAVRGKNVVTEKVQSRCCSILAKQHAWEEASGIFFVSGGRRLQMSLMTYYHFRVTVIPTTATVGDTPCSTM